MLCNVKMLHVVHACVERPKRQMPKNIVLSWATNLANLVALERPKKHYGRSQPMFGSPLRDPVPLWFWHTAYIIITRTMPAGAWGTEGCQDKVKKNAGIEHFDEFGGHPKSSQVVFKRRPERFQKVVCFKIVILAGRFRKVILKGWIFKIQNTEFVDFRPNHSFFLFAKERTIVQNCSLARSSEKIVPSKIVRSCEQIPKWSILAQIPHRITMSCCRLIKSYSERIFCSNDSTKLKIFACGAIGNITK